MTSFGKFHRKFKFIIVTIKASGLA